VGPYASRCLGCGGRAKVVYSRTVTVDGLRVCWRITVCLSTPGCPSEERKRRQTICDEGPTRHSWIAPDTGELPKHMGRHRGR